MTTVSNCLWCGSTKLEPFAHRKDEVGIIECQNCHLVMVDRFPENLDEYYYTEEYYNAEESNVDTGYAEIYDLMAPAFLFWQSAFVEEANEAHAKKSFLEIGAATGNLLEILRDQQPNLRLKGIDISEYAAGAARNKGFDAEVAYIEKYKANPKLDIIFSSETLEHLDNLKSFLEGVQNNLKDDGMFLFYVPSISLKDAQKERDNYLRFNRNLEHLLHFTPEFMQKEFSKFFKADVLIKEFITGFGPCIVGAVSKNPANLADLKKLFAAMETNTLPKNPSDTMLKNIVVFALKFGQFELADAAFAEIEARGVIDKQDMYILQGLLGYHKGELVRSNKAFESYLKGAPGSLFAIRSLLANEREMTHILREEVGKAKDQALQMTSRAADAETEVKNMKNAKSIKLAMQAQRVRRGVPRRLGVAKRKARSAVIHAGALVVPRKLRPHVKSFIKQEWRVKHVTVENQKLTASQPLVSVVIPYYNRADTIVETLDSLRAQTFQGFEVIIVDDGSREDQAVKKIDKQHFRDLNVQFMAQKNQGVAAARNTGLAKTKGRYVMCLDSDDILEPTFIEKYLVVLETDANVDMVGSHQRLFGVSNYVYEEIPYDPLHLIDNNMLITAAMVNRQGWEKTGGYKSGIGYEDWEYWINLAENGFWGRNIPEPLFNYRTAAESRYVDDIAKHKENMQAIRALHPAYTKRIHRLHGKRRFIRKHVAPETMFANLDDPKLYKLPHNGNPNVLITIPWMTFGGAETLIYNFCKEIKQKFNISFITGLESEHQWEYMFKEVSTSIYHLPNLFTDKDLYVEFVSNYIKTRDIQVLHVIHNGFMFDMLDELKARHPGLKVVVTMFNDRVPYFNQAVEYEHCFDMFTTDNQAVANHFAADLGDDSRVRVLPNGIDCYNIFNPSLFDRAKKRHSLGIADDDMAVFFVGRLSEEKNPDVFLHAARKVLKTDKAVKVRFFVIGDGPMRPVTDKLVEQIGSDKVKYLGYQPPQDVAQYLTAADVFVLPSAVEGFPLSLLEAMAMELATVSSRVGAIPDVIRDGKDGFIITPGSTDEITDIVMQLNNDRQKLTKVKELARAKVEGAYSNTILGKNYTVMYKDLMS